MLKVDNKMEELFLSDSVPKNLTIDVEGELDTSLIPSVNFYTGDIYGNSECTTDISNLQYNYGTIIGVNNNPYSKKLKDYMTNLRKDSYVIKTRIITRMLNMRV